MPSDARFVSRPGRVSRLPLRTLAWIGIIATMSAHSIFSADGLERRSVAPGPRALHEAPAHDGSRRQKARVPRLIVRSAGVDAPIISVGKSGNTIEVPKSASLVGWYRRTAFPGERGAAVLVGHNTWHGRAALYDLHEVELGDRVVVRRSHGSFAVFFVESLDRYRKAALPLSVFRQPSRGAMLRLITCAGRYDERTGYQKNLVVTARAQTRP